jgi:hypothetical protein
MEGILAALKPVLRWIIKGGGHSLPRQRSETMTMPRDVTAASAPGMLETETAEQSTGARAQIREAKDLVVNQAKRSFREAKDSATSSLTDSRKQAADRIGAIAGAVRSTSGHLRSENQPGLANLADSLADQAERLSSYLRDRDLRAVRDDAEYIARRQPGATLGVALVLGIIAARFFKSSPRAGSASSSRPASGSNDYDMEPERDYAAESGVAAGYGLA